VNVPSLTFFVFAALAALAYQLCPVVWGRRLILGAANVYFLSTYAQGLWAFVPLAAFLLLGYLSIRRAQRGVSSAAFGLMLTIVIFAFVWLKRYTFLPSVSFLPFAYVTLGLSYVFFRVLHLIIDAKDDALPPVPALSYLNYTLNFTTLVSGPIQRFQDFHAMETHPKALNLVVVGHALERIVIGSFKVLIISALLNSEHLRALEALPHDTAPLVKLGDGLSIALVYPIYLFFNFSGYIDIVIGVGRFFGIELPENFNRPFASENFINFWSRWHITLSTWLKTYVYSPLLMTLMRRYPDRSIESYLGVFAFFVTFFLIGVWHGQTSVFIFFGFLQGLGVSVNKLYQITMAKRLGRTRYKQLCSHSFYRSATRGLTFCWFAFTLFWFWSDWHQIGLVFSTLGGSLTAALWIVAFFGGSLILAAMEALRAAVLNISLGGVQVVTSRYVRTVYETALVVVTVATAVLLNAPAPDIVYKAF
jgi:alginate O-acetyltransferase complex protein AlgI